MGERPGVCAVVACERVRYIRGLCALHYKRWWSGHPLTGPRRSSRVVYTCRTCGAAWCRIPGTYEPQSVWCSRECRLGEPFVVQPLVEGTLAVTAAVLVSVQRGATNIGVARVLGLSLPRIEQHLATGRALLAGQPHDKLDERALLPLGQASRSIGVARTVLEQRIAAGDVHPVPHPRGVRLPTAEVRRVRHELLLEMLARHLVRAARDLATAQQL